jgi:uncharacterized membrane protein
MKRIIIFLTLILVTFLTSRFLFEPINLYHEFVFLDIPMHILGGYLIGGLILAISFYKKGTISLTSFLLGLFVVMIVWEVYEYLRGVILYDKISDVYDSLSDLLFGFLGGLTAYKYNKR